MKKCISCACALEDDFEGIVCQWCYRDPDTNDCEDCGRHLNGICYPYVCGDCLEWKPCEKFPTGE